MTKQISELECNANSIAFAAEYPTSCHDLAFQFTDYDFCISLIAMRDSKYRLLFDERHERRYRIVDSGIFEDPHNPITAHQHIKTAMSLSADEVIAVDLINDCDGTLRCMDEFLGIAEAFPFKIQGVVQGKTLKEWLRCYEEFEANPRVDVIGLAYFDVPKDLAELGMSTFDVPDKAEAARLTLLHLIAGGIGVDTKTQVIDSGDAFRYRGPIRKPIHILGLRHVRALRYYRALPFVRSIDTSFPVQLAIEGRPLHMDSPKPAFKVNYIAEPIRAERALIVQNLFRFQRLCRGIDETIVWETVDRIAGTRSI